MTRKTHAAVKDAQADLLGPAAKPPQPAKPIAKVKPAAKKSASRQIAISMHNEPRSMIAVIAEAASNPNCNVEKMQALLTMQREIEAKDENREFIRDFIALQNELPSISRDGKIEIRAKDESGRRQESGRVQQSTPYATFNNIMKVVKPLLVRHHFALSFATEPSAGGDRIIVKGILDHVSIHQRTTAFPLPAETSGSKNNVQGWGSSMSYGKRYATIALLNIVSYADEDADRNGSATAAKRGARNPVDAAAIEGEGVELISEQQHDKLVDALEACGAKRPDFCKAYSIDKVSDLPAKFFDRAMKACADRKEKANG